MFTFQEWWSAEHEQFMVGCCRASTFKAYRCLHCMDVAWYLWMTVWQVAHKCHCPYYKTFHCKNIHILQPGMTLLGFSLILRSTIFFFHLAVLFLFTFLYKFLYLQIFYTQWTLYFSGCLNKHNQISLPRLYPIWFNALGHLSVVS